MLGADQRGQAIQIGAIILFSFAVIAFSLYQATVVPDQNAQVEFNHNQEVQQDMLELRSGILSTAQTGDGTPVSVRLGATYPARIFAVNPGPPSGSLRTFEPGDGSDLNISNASALDDEVNDYWDGASETYSTKGVRYTPLYNFYTEAPTTVYENGIVYNRGPDRGVSVRSEQRLVNGRELDLTTLQGEYQQSTSETVSADIRSPSNEPRTVSVQAATPDRNVTIRLPTDLSEATWDRLLADQLESNGGYISELTVNNGQLTITLQAEEDGAFVTYELRVPAAGIGTEVNEPGVAYITGTSGGGTSIPEGGTQQVIAEVRNEFNGPESGVSVCAETSIPGSNSGSIQSEPATTGDDGRVSFVYEAPDDVDRTRTATVTLGYVCGGGDPQLSAGPETKATFEIDVLNSDGSGGNTGGDGNNDSPPTASIDSVADNSACSDIQNNGNCAPQATTNIAEFDVSWSASDDNGISTVTLSLIDSDGTTVDTANPSASGTSASGTVTLSKQDGYNEEYTIQITVTDSNSQTGTDSTTEIADGA